MYTRKTWGTYSPHSKEPYKISRSKIELFLSCSRCFYMDCRLGLSRPSTPPYTLNNAVDTLLKNEFDILRKTGDKHELVKKYGINAIPFKHQDLPQWRGEVKAYEGALVVDEKSNLLINGLVDDIWQNEKEELVIVDYKATSTTKEISLDDEYKQSYKRQMEIYQWIFRKLGFSVSNVGYFVFANATKNRDSFDGKLEFEMTILEHTGNSSWVDLTLLEIAQCLKNDRIPAPAPDCEYCAYKQLSSLAAKVSSQK
jgi:PD-(D/E)XK nuclease superfamily